MKDVLAIDPMGIISTDKSRKFEGFGKLERAEYMDFGLVKINPGMNGLQ